MRNPKAQHIDFSFMEGLIESNKKWLGCNIDMCCERHGQFLFAEWKRPKEELPTGQRILLRALASNPNCFVFIVNGYSGQEGTIVNTVYRLYDKREVKVAQGLEEWKTVIINFYNWADKLPFPNKS